MSAEPNRETTPESVAIGPHRIDLPAPDLVIVRWLAEVTVEHIRELGRVIHERPHEGRGIFVIFDLRRAGPIGPEARKLSMSDDIFEAVRGVVAFGADYPTRIMATLISKAARLLRPRGKNTDFVFANDETEALALLEGMREKTAEGLSQ